MHVWVCLGTPPARTWPSRSMYTSDMTKQTGLHFVYFAIRSTKACRPMGGGRRPWNTVSLPVGIMCWLPTCGVGVGDTRLDRNKMGAQTRVCNREHATLGTLFAEESASGVITATLPDCAPTCRGTGPGQMRSHRARCHLLLKFILLHVIFERSRYKLGEAGAGSTAVSHLPARDRQASRHAHFNGSAKGTNHSNNLQECKQLLRIATVVHNARRPATP